MTMEEVAASRRARTVRPFNALRHNNPKTDVFASVSLTRWLTVAQAAGVPAVGGKSAYLFPIETFLYCEEPRPEDAVHWDALRELSRNLKPNEMLRWDCCASGLLKSRMSTTDTERRAQADAQTDPDNPQVSSWRSELSPFDMRAFDLVPEYPAEFIPIVVRPWVQARQEGSHPAEYRVFVENGQVVGLANYYLQRPLELTDAVRQDIEAVLAQAGEMTAFLARAKLSPWTARQYASEQDVTMPAWCTMDFLVTPEGQALFLEAGPPFGLGAHPCSFAPSDRSQKVSVHGICLKTDGPVWDLAEFKQTPSFDPSQDNQERPS